MPKSPVVFAFSIPALDPNSASPLHKQLYEELRQSILSGRLAAGTRLPSTRTIANELGVSRNTVLNAFAQLLAEGYLDSQVGDGTYVIDTLPEELLHTRTENDRAARAVNTGRRLSKRGQVMAETSVHLFNHRGIPHAFRPGLPAFDEFPVELWARLHSRYWKHMPRELLTYGEAGGYPPLRQAIADYLSAARGVCCTAEQVIIVAGSQQALDVATRILLDPGDAAWMEDPGYPGARATLQAAGANVIPVPVAADGLDVAAGIQRCPSPRVIYLTPSHQNPLGVTMSLSRRLALLEHASRVGAWLLEDDYASEYRYISRPVAALQGLDHDNRVIYIGTFSKVLLPSLRLGYLVVPPDLIHAFTAAHAAANFHAPTLDQAVLADFITEGHFARHIRRMRVLYQQRQAALIEAAERELGGLLEVHEAECGLQLVGWLPEGVHDDMAVSAARRYGVESRALSFYSIEPPERGGLLLGYAFVTESEIAEGAKQLGKALRAMG